MKTVNLVIPFMLGGASIVSAQSSKPNVVFIMADDMGYECLGTYGSTYETPCLDQMAEKGIKFNYAFSQPLSTPSRVQVMTGRYNYCNYSRFGFLNQDQKTFGNLAKMAGYATAIVGKWQLGGNSKLPVHFGFDNYCLWQLNYGRGKNGVGERYANPLIEQDGRVLDHNADIYGPDLFADYVDDFIETNKHRPFFLYYPIVLVHDPFVSTPQSSDWSTNFSGRFISNTRYFSDMVSYCDMLVGRVIDKLKKEGLYDNTLIIFTADNGTLPQIITPMKDGTKVKGGKSYATDAGTHVPLIVTYGAYQCRPYVCDDLVDFTDIMPTLAQAMGVEVPVEWDTHGVSFLPQILGQKGTPRKWAFCHYDPVKSGGESKARRWIRTQRYKLYSTGEFYDMAEDVLEQHPIPEGCGSAQAEADRKFLAAELAKFPKWEMGDPTAPKVEYPELKSVLLKYEEKAPLK